MTDLTINLFWIAPIYNTFVCFWFTFAFLGGGRSFRLTERRSGLALKNFAKVLLLFQIPKDTVFSYAGAPLSNVRVAFLKPYFFDEAVFVPLNTIVFTIPTNHQKRFTFDEIAVQK